MLPLSPQARGALFVLAGATCISFAPLFVRLPDAGPTTVVFYRLLWGFFALLLVTVLRGERLMPGRTLLPLLVLLVLAAFFWIADLACWHQSIIYLGPGLATLICNFQVFFLSLAGVLFLRERIGPALALAIPLAVAGLWLVLDIDVASMPSHITAGIALGLFAAIFYAAYILTLRHTQRRAERLTPLASMTVVSFFGILFAGALSLIQGQSLLVPSLQSNLFLLLYGVSCHAAGWLLLCRGLPLLPASRAGLLMLIQPALSFTWDVLFCGRPTGLAGYCGVALVLFAIFLGMSDRNRAAPREADRPDNGKKHA